MKTPKTPAAVVFVLLAIPTIPCFSQKQRTVPVCTQVTFAAFKPLPKLEYDCPDGVSDSDDKILKLPERAAAIGTVLTELQSFTDAAWWQASVDDLNACEVHGRAGALTDEEKDQWRRGDHNFPLLGDYQMRLVLLPDPCYQTGFGGANAFLLYRKGAKVFVTQLLNGNYSRVDNSVGIDFAQLNGRQIIEVSTANSMPPSLLYHYFVIDKTNSAVPIKLFKDRRKLTSEIWSAMPLSEGGGELKVIQRHRLSPSFSVYEDDDRGRIDDNGRKLRRVAYRWNGRFYVRARK